MHLIEGFTVRADKRPALAAAICTLALLHVACGGPTPEPQPQPELPIPTLVRAAPEPAGDNCAAGGTAILTGRDASQNGILDDAEIDATATHYVCATESFRSLVTFSPEPRGANCTYGGTRISGGLDTDGDGTLGETEIDSTDFLCNSQLESATYFGSFVITSAADLALLEDIELVVGNLEFQLHAEQLNAIHLPSLKEIRGDLYLWPNNEYPAEMAPDAVSLRFPNLTRVGDLEIDLTNVGVFEMPELARVDEEADVWSQKGAITSISFPSLSTVSETFSVRYSPTIESVRLPALTQGSISLYQNDGLVSFEAPLLQRARYIEYRYNPLITDVSLPQLTEVEYFDVTTQPLVTTLALPALRTAGNLQIHSMGGLTSLTLPTLTSLRSLRASNNANLTTISFTALESLGGVDLNSHPVLATLELPFTQSLMGYNSGVHQNPMLSECVVINLHARLITAGYTGAFNHSSNLADSACATNSASTCAALETDENGTTRNYSLCLVKSSFAQARTDCQALASGADLAVFETDAEYVSMRETLVARKVGNSNVPGPLYSMFTWIGLSDVDAPGTFAWVNGSMSPVPPGPTFWDTAQPAGNGCAALVNGSWYGWDRAGRALIHGCGNQYPLLCELPASTP